MRPFLFALLSIEARHVGDDTTRGFFDDTDPVTIWCTRSGARTACRSSRSSNAAGAPRGLGGVLVSPSRRRRVHGRRL